MISAPNVAVKISGVDTNELTGSEYTSGLDYVVLNGAQVAEPLRTMSQLAVEQHPSFSNDYLHQTQQIPAKLRPSTISVAPILPTSSNRSAPNQYQLPARSSTPSRRQISARTAHSILQRPAKNSGSSGKFAAKQYHPQLRLTNEPKYMLIDFI